MLQYKVHDVENGLGKLDMLIDRCANLIQNVPDVLVTAIPQSEAQR